MKKYEIIKNNKYFNHIIRNGNFIKDKNFVIYYVKNDGHNPHFGIAIKKKIGNAVLRNRLKRQTRAIIDKNRKLFKFGQDYIIMIREGCILSNFNVMNVSLIHLMKGKNYEEE